MTNLSSSSNFLDNRSFSLDKTWVTKSRVNGDESKSMLAT